MQGKCPLNHGNFPPQTLPVHAGSLTGHPFHVVPRQHRRNRGTRRRVPDAHFPDGDKSVPLRARGLGQVHSNVKGRQRLLTRHRGFMKEIFRSTGNLVMQETDVRAEVFGHAHVYHAQRSTGVTSQDVHRGTVTDEIPDHLRGHGLWVRTHPFSRHAVVGGQRKDHGSKRRRRDVSRHPDVARGHLLKSSETARGLGQRIKTSACPGPSVFAQRPDFRNHVMNRTISHLQDSTASEDALISTSRGDRSRKDTRHPRPRPRADSWLRHNPGIVASPRHREQCPGLLHC